MSIIDPRILDLLGYGSEPASDPRAQAIERYMQEQGNESRMPVYHPLALTPRVESDSLSEAAPVPMSPNEAEVAYDEMTQRGALVDDFIAEMMKSLKPYYGGEGVQRRFFPKR